MFRPVPAEADFTVLEADELARWGEHRVFERSVELRAGAEPWVFYEGPPDRQRATRAAPRVGPGLQGPVLPVPDHAGLSPCPARPGWDTHGLPVEVEVEKQLGITDKRQIEEEVGIAEFTRLCRESVRNYVDEWKALTERIGYWIDIDDAYWTFSPGLHRVGVVEPQVPLGPGPALRGHQGGPVLPPVRHRPRAATSWASPTSTGRWSTSRPTSCSP